jgi:hypothetical protein
MPEGEKPLNLRKGFDPADPNVYRVTWEFADGSTVIVNFELAEIRVDSRHAATIRASARPARKVVRPHLSIRQRPAPAGPLVNFYGVHAGETRSLTMPGRGERPGDGERLPLPCPSIR